MSGIFQVESRRIVACVMMLMMGVSGVSLSQTPADDSRATSVLQLSETEQRQFVESVLNRGFPEDEGDRFAILLVNRSGTVVPILGLKVQQELKKSRPSERFIDLLSEMIAYAGCEESLDAITDLIRIDEDRFGQYIGRTLDNAIKWQNPFSLAYQAFEFGDAALTRHATAWSKSVLASDRLQRLWAKAMLDRYGNRPIESEWARDPIASRIGASLDLRDRVLKVVAELRRNPR
jgi:hypothetical protein